MKNYLHCGFHLWHYSLNSESLGGIRWEFHSIPEVKTTILVFFLLMVMGLKIISAQVAAEPLMSLPCAKYVWLVVKNKIGPFQVKFFGWSPSSGDMLPFWELPTG